MIGHLVLVIMQFGAAFLGAPLLLQFIPVGGDARIFVHAALYAAIVWIVGCLACFVLREVRTPTWQTLASALLGSIVGAALMFMPQLIAAIPFKFPPLYLPLGGAILGYLARR